MVFSAQEASASLSQKISLGDKGIAEVTRSLCEVNVANAQAYDPRDEKKVKDTIRESVGFQAKAPAKTSKLTMIDWLMDVDGFGGVFIIYTFIYICQALF